MAIPDVLIVGAGPVGLWTAVQIKLRNRNLTVQIWEKHAEYQRKHLLQLNPSSLKGAPKEMDEIVREFSRSRSLGTNVIEERLAKLASDLGIVIQKNKPVTEPRDLQARVVVGADGAHSIVRREIFGGQMALEQDLRYIVEVKYEVKGQGKALNLVKAAYPTLKLMKAIAQEYVGKEKDGKTQITLRLFIDKQKYEELRKEGADFQNPFNLESEGVRHTELSRNIWTWLNVKEQHGEFRIPQSEKITVTRLGVYASKEVACQCKDKVCFLVGDAAFGVPFFRSLNNGLLCGTQLSKRIVEVLNPERGPLKSIIMSPLSRYSLYVKTLQKTEVLWARVKNFFLSILLWFVQISARVPWQINYWSEAEAFQLQQPSEAPIH